MRHVALVGVFAATLAANAGLCGFGRDIIGIISLVVMSFFAMIALNVVDAVFLCSRWIRIATACTGGATRCCTR